LQLLNFWQQKYSGLLFVQQTTRSTPGLHYLVDSKTVHKGVLYSDSFYVATRYCMRVISSTRCRLLITFQLKFVKRVWLLEHVIQSTVQKTVKETMALLGRNQTLNSVVEINFAAHLTANIKCYNCNISDPTNDLLAESAI
jgi:VAD1 Analog of StAR-related lipid transfer domain